MQETTPLEAPEQPAFRTGPILKEAWRISTTCFWPLTMAIFVIRIPEKIMVSLAHERHSWQLSLWYEMLVSGFVFVGVYRSIYKLKAEGISPTFGGVYAEGQPYFGRNFRMSWLVNLFTILPLGVFAAVAIPSSFTLRDGNNAPWSYLLMGVAIIVGLLFMTWWTIRIFMCRAALSDDASGGMKAIGHAFDLSKGRVGMLAPVVLSLAGIYLTWFILHMLVLLLFAGDINGEVSKAVEIKVSMITSLPLAFAEVLATVITALTYLHLTVGDKKAETKPYEAPATENPSA